ncbi:MAG: hypothetical protein JKX85_10885 [Phycisphaeraceae bacterium]|nr:hypothetical protein [Phycisphaeraceae bacterium]
MNPPDFSWNAQVTAASFIGKGFWSSEIKIPFYSLGITSKVGSNWRINLCREKKKPGELTSIAEKGAFNIAAQFIALEGMDVDLSRYCYTIDPPQMRMSSKGGALALSLDVGITNGTGHAEPVLLDCWLVGPSGQTFVKTSLITPTASQQAQFVAGDFTLTEQGTYTCSVRVADPVTKKTLAIYQTPMLIEYVPVAIDLIKPWYRNAIFATQNIKQVVMDLKVNLDFDQEGRTLADVSICDVLSGEVLVSKQVSVVGEVTRVVFDTASLPNGKMEIKVVLRDESGKNIAASMHPLRKLARKQGEVWLGEDLNWHVDGNRFLLMERGTMEMGSCLNITLL